MYSAKFNLLFIHIPKTAGQSITQHFMQIECIPWEHRKRYQLFPNGNPEHGPPQTAHFTLEEYYKTDFLPDEAIDQAIKFAVVRNPWDRLWSEYNFFWEHICSWDQFFEYFPHHIFDDHKTGRDALRHIKPQNEFITPEVEVLRFENLTTDFADFCERHGLPNRGLPSKTNASNAVGYRDMYDATKIQAVRNFYSEDIELFGYDIWGEK